MGSAGVLENKKLILLAEDLWLNDFPPFNRSKDQLGVRDWLAEWMNDLNDDNDALSDDDDDDALSDDDDDDDDALSDDDDDDDDDAGVWDP